jgi:SAM-dependent methyltransferase
VLERTARLLSIHRDVLEARPADGRPPAALVHRAWDAFLLALDDATLDALEIGGLEWPEGTPASLLAMIEEARAVSAIPLLPSVAATALRRRETPRKRAQIDAFARVIVPLAERAARVVDVGSGHGHLTRDIAARIARPVVGLERDPSLAERARSLPMEPELSFAVTDVLREGLSLRSDDCVIGLHTCGELGDAIVEAAAREGASVAFVGCCLQKRRSESRRSLCSELELSTRVLGLSNLTARDAGVEASRHENLAARERRLALHRLLGERVGPLRFGAEIDGLNRRVAHGSLRLLVERAFARRGLALPSRIELERAAKDARAQHARARRLSLPRAMLARPLEVFVLLDRASFLERHGLTVEIGVLFPNEVSARNLALLARK